VKNYYSVHAAQFRGITHDNDLPWTLIRNNVESGPELVARFHSNVYANQFADTLNEEVAATGLLCKEEKWL
jgi:hypothetical protein